MKVIIIGSGLAGMTAGSYFVQKGHDVTVYEQFHKIGGVTGLVEQDGYKWEIGPLLLGGFGPRESGTVVLTELGLYDKMEFTLEDRGLEFPDFKLWRPENYEGRYWRREKLKEFFPEESEGIDAYYEFYTGMIDLMNMDRDLEFKKGLGKLLLKLKMGMKFSKYKKYLDWSAAQLLDSFFKEQKIKALLTGILADIVVKPSEFPALGIPQLNVESSFDKRILTDDLGMLGEPTYQYLHGGAFKIIEEMEKLILDKGGIVKTNSKVEKIIIEDGKATGVRLEDGTVEKSDLIFASGSIPDIFDDVIGRENLPNELTDKIDNLRYMESCFFVHLGVNFNPLRSQPKQLCYYYQTYDIEAAVEESRNGNYHKGKEGFLIYVPSIHSPEMAPEGKYAVTIYTICPDRLSEGSWEEKKDEYADLLIMEAEKKIPGLYEGIETRMVMTPADFRKQINAKRHSFGGLAPIMGQSGPAHKTPIKNLWYIGAYSESGGGVAGTMWGTRNAVKKILEE
ncbi:MAG: phytoene desaturase family protein [Promethearchaeota archaeon]